MRTANSGEQMEGFSVIMSWKNPLGKADRWGLTCGPSVTESANSSARHESLSYAHIQSFCTFPSLVWLKLQFQKCHFTQISRFSPFTGY